LPSIEFPIDLHEQNELPSVMLIEDAPPETIEHIAPAPPPSVLVNGGSLASGGNGPGIGYPPYGNPTGRPPDQSRYDVQPPLHDAAAPIGVPINQSVEEALSPPSAQTEPAPSCPLPGPSPFTAEPAVGPTAPQPLVHYGYPPDPPTGRHKLWGFFPQESLFDQQESVITQVAKPSEWYRVGRQTIGSKNKRLVFEIARAHRSRDPAAAIAALRNRTVMRMDET
jgi:hypothetical protein